MKFFLPLVLVLAGQLNFSITAAQTAGEILDKYFIAIGGLSKHDSVKSTRYEGHSYFDGVLQQVRIIQAKDILRQDIMERGFANFLLFTGDKAWVYHEGTSKKLRKLEGELKKKYEAAMQVESSLNGYKLSGFKASLEGKDSADGKQCYKLKINEPGREEFAVWFDCETHLKVQSEVKTVAGFYNKDGQVEDVDVNLFTAFRDYKNVDGLLEPFTCLMNAYDVTTNKCIRTISCYFNKIEINKPVEPGLYKPRPYY